MKAALIVLAMACAQASAGGLVSTYNAAALPAAYNPLLTYGHATSYSYQHHASPVKYVAPAAVSTYAYQSVAPAHQAVTYAAPAHHAVTYAAPAVVPVGTKTQYHAQDVLGQASYGYSYPGQAAHAVRDAAGNVRGSYAYVNPDGNEIRVNYVADHGGFRAESNALPQAPVHVVPASVAHAVVPASPAQVVVGAAPAPVAETPEVVEARAAHAHAHAEARARNLLVSRKKRGVVSSAPVVSYSAAAVPAATALTYSAVHHPTAYTTAVHHPAAYSAYGYSSAVHHPTAYASVAPVSTYAAVAPVSTYTQVINNPGHAVSYRVY